MATLRIQATFERATGLPEDRVVNTFHVDTAAIVKAAAVDLIATRLDQMFLQLSGAQVTPLRQYMSPTLRALNYRAYDLADPKPREATVKASPTWTAPPAATIPLPTEVAVVSSYYASRNLPRQRGRFYFGPLITTALAPLVSTAADVRPLPQLITDLAAATRGLVVNLALDGLRLVVFSGVDLIARGVTNGWVDNAFDTQRRRGASANGRNLWAS